MMRKDLKVIGSKVLILGFTFKEDCPDVRNTRVIDIYNEFVQFGLNVDVYDPHADESDVKKEFGISLLDEIDKLYDVVVLAVSHDKFLSIDWNKITKIKESVIFDTKAFLGREIITARL